MKKEVKRTNHFLFILILILLSIQFISSATIVVNEPVPEKKPTFFDTYFGFVKSPIFWYVILGFIVLVLFLIALFFLISWIVKFLKSKNDVFYVLKKERVALSKIHSRYPSSKHWFKVQKNVPIRFVKKESGKLVISQPFAYHRGDYTAHEGNIIISMNLSGNNKWFIFPITSVLIIPDKESVTIQRKDTKTGKDDPYTITNIPTAKDIVQFNHNEILIFAESVSSIGNFYVPVLKATDGKIIDLSLPVYQSQKEVILGNYLYEQTASFVGVAKKSIDLNPNLRFEIKSKDSNSNVEVPSNNDRR